MSDDDSGEANKRDIKGIWIPIEVWEDPALSFFDRALLAEIDSLDRGKGCWAENDFLSKRMGCSTSHLKNRLTWLHQNDYLKRRWGEDGVRRFRTYYSRHGQAYLKKYSVLKKVRQSTEKSTGLRDDEAENDEQSSGSNGAGNRESTVRVQKEIQKKACSLVARFAAFSETKRWHVGQAEKLARKSGWTGYTIGRWKVDCFDLIKAVEGIAEIERVLEWYIKHHRDEYMPEARTFTAFCRKYAQLKARMDRSAPSEDEDDPGPGVGRIRVNGKYVTPNED